MRTQCRLRLLLPALVPVLLLAGCDESDPVAPPESTIILSASPTTLPAGGGDSNLSAVVIDGNGVPLDGVAVFFSTNAGSLASQGVSQVTDDNGRAVDLLTTTQSAQVDAQSGDAKAQVTVTVGGQQLVGAIALNCQPVTGAAPLMTACTALVTSSTGTGTPLPNVTLSVSVPGDPLAVKVDPFPDTDASGQARFEVENITQDTNILASAGSVNSNAVAIDVTP